MKQAIVDRNAFVASSALMSGIRLFATCPEVVRRWINEVQEAVNSSSDMVQYHALSLLYKIKQHDRLAVSKIVQQLSKGSLRSPLATCLLIRYTSNLLHEDLNATNARAAYQFLENCLRHKSEMVIYEAAKAICNLPGVDATDLNPAITVLQLFLSSPKPALRFAAMRTLSEVAVKQPISVAKCNDDMESLVSDSNRSIATLAITTLLKTGNESSIDRLMKQISTFMNEIGDEFKIVVVKAIRELCIKYPQKQRALVGFLATFLREEGGYEFKKSIVDSIIDLMTTIPDTKETSLLHLCEFIEDCEFDELIVQVLHLIGSTGPSTSSPSRFIRYVFNRVILENALVRAAAVTALGTLAVRVPELRQSILILIRRSLADEDDEVRDRAAIIVRSLESFNDAEVQYIFDEPPPMNFSALERSVKAYLAHSQHSAGQSAANITFASLPIVEDAYVPPAGLPAARAGTKKSTKPGASSSGAGAETVAEVVDPAAAVYKVPEFAKLGRAFRSTGETALTESEMEYVVTVSKHIFETHIVFQFNVLNTIDDQQLRNVYVNIDVSDTDLYEVDKVVPAAIGRYGEQTSTFVSVVRKGDPVGVTLACELHFKVVQVNPTTGEVEGDDKGYDEEYPLEGFEVTTRDFMAKVSVPDFRRAWETQGGEGEVMEKFGLPFKKIEEAVNAVLDYLGMQACDGTANVPQGDDAKRVHTLHLSGVFVGNVPVLVRSMLQLDDAVGVVLKLAIRSPNPDVSRLVSECIN